MNWTDERVELLKKLWSDGLSASQIAAELGGITRNAVIGKVHRLGLSGRANELAASLAYGEQRRLEIARALGTNPGVLLLDEPAAGTNPAEKRDLAELIKRINKVRGTSVLLIEHDMKLVMSVADRIVVLNFGGKIAEGTPHEIQRDPVVIAAYLGTSAEEAAQTASDAPELHLLDTDTGMLGEESVDDEH